MSNFINTTKAKAEAAICTTKSTINNSPIASAFTKGCKHGLKLGCTQVGMTFGAASVINGFKEKKPLQVIAGALVFAGGMATAKDIGRQLGEDIMSCNGAD